jgi:hypothetical protein
VIAAFLGQVLPVPLAHHGFIAGGPFAAGFKKMQYAFFCVAEGHVRFCHLTHADKYNHAFKEAEKLVGAYGILLRTKGKFLIKGVLIVHNQVINRAGVLNSPEARAKDIFERPVVLLRCCSAYLLYSVHMVRERHGLLLRQIVQLANSLSFINIQINGWLQKKPALESTGLNKQNVF